jgi:alkanesulfonate monooxygenase SsuD/methylene tetrahydromethanopterin reductase-like flavin-dependent oxidoreductase (luciferase family)
MIFDTTLGNFGANADPVAMADTARAADELGFRALWGADHLLPPSSQPQFARLLEHAPANLGIDDVWRQSSCPYLLYPVRSATRGDG